MAAAAPRRPATRALGLLAFLFLVGSISTALWLGSLHLGAAAAAGGRRCFPERCCWVWASAWR